jgi:7,8-dihydroneopterin aldolase/epimerase/oxygenase
MLSISLHGIKLHAPIGLYPQERVVGNYFEIDVDIYMPANNENKWPFIDYSMVYDVVQEIFQQQERLLETVVHKVYTALKEKVPAAEKIKVAVRKLHPPLNGDVHYAQVAYEG